MITREEFIKTAKYNSFYIPMQDRNLSNTSDISAWSNKFPWLVFNHEGFVTFTNWVDKTSQSYYNLEDFKASLPDIKLAIKKRNIESKIYNIERDFV